MWSSWKLSFSPMFSHHSQYLLGCLSWHHSWIVLFEMDKEKWGVLKALLSLSVLVHWFFNLFGLVLKITEFGRREEITRQRYFQMARGGGGEKGFHWLGSLDEKHSSGQSCLTNTDALKFKRPWRRSLEGWGGAGKQSSVPLPLSDSLHLWEVWGGQNQ